MIYGKILNILNNKNELRQEEKSTRKDTREPLIKKKDIKLI